MVSLFLSNDFRENACFFILKTKQKKHAQNVHISELYVKKCSTLHKRKTKHTKRKNKYWRIIAHFHSTHSNIIIFSQIFKQKLPNMFNFAGSSRAEQFQWAGKQCDCPCVIVHKHCLSAHRNHSVRLELVIAHAWMKSHIYTFSKIHFTQIQNSFYSVINCRYCEFEWNMG